MTSAEPDVPIPSTRPGLLPRVSVVIPSYDYGYWLEGCVQAALDQDGVDVDVTIVDDASTDDSVVVARRLAAGDERVHVVARTENRGHIATFNEALWSGTSPYVYKLDPDDVVAPGALRRATDVLDANPAVVFVYGPVETFRGERPDMTTAPAPPETATVWPGVRWIDRVTRRGLNVIYQPEVVIRRSALEAVGGHLPEVAAASDLNLWLRLARQGDVARVGGAVQGYYRLHEQSMQRTIHAGYLADLSARRDAFDLFFDREGADLAERDRLRLQVHRALAREALGRVLSAGDKAVGLGAPAAEYLDFAASLDPDLRHGRVWSGLSSGRLPHPGRLARRYRTARTNLGYRLRSRRWQRTGFWS